MSFLLQEQQDNQQATESVLSENQNFSWDNAGDLIFGKLSTWLDTFIANLPNIILAIIVFILFVIVSKYIGKLFKNVIL